MQTERYKALRLELIHFLAEHPEPDSVVETSYIANQLDEFARKMDAIAADALTETVREFSTTVRETEIM